VPSNYVQLQGNPTGTSFADTGLAQSTGYHYRLTAYSAQGTQLAQTLASTTTLAADPGRVTVTWTIYGEPPTARSCGGVDVVHVSISGPISATRNAHCTAGSLVFDGVPSGQVGVDASIDFGGSGAPVVADHPPALSVPLYPGHSITVNVDFRPI
jgi:hypothetical protein